MTYPLPPPPLPPVSVLFTPHPLLLLLLLRRVRRRTSLNGSAATAENADEAQAEASLEALVEEEAAMPPVTPDR